jgi:hypothetical protein
MRRGPLSLGNCANDRRSHVQYCLEVFGAAVTGCRRTTAPVSLLYLGQGAPKVPKC